MQLTTMGIVVREVKTGESDRIISILTPEYGIISAAAKGSLRLKSKLFSSTGLFCYSEFNLEDGYTMYRVKEAEIREVFYGIRQSIEGMALAMYCAELACVFSPDGEDAQEVMRLLLNSFYFISQGKRPLLQIKSIFQLKVLCLSGFMPSLIACEGCSVYDGMPFYFNIAQGNLLCQSCAEKGNQIPNLCPSALSAMRHIVFAQDEKLFNFIITSPAIEQLDFVATSYTCHCVDRPLRSLEFLQGVL